MGKVLYDFCLYEKKGEGMDLYDMEKIWLSKRSLGLLILQFPGSRSLLIPVFQTTWESDFISLQFYSVGVFCLLVTDLSAECFL